MCRKLLVAVEASNCQWLAKQIDYWINGREMNLNQINYLGVPKSQWYENPECRARVLSEFEKIPDYLQLDFLREIDAVAPGIVN